MVTTPDRLPAGPLTYEDYAELPEDGNTYEILDGELFVTPAPVPRHQRVSANLLWQPDIVFIAKGHEAIVTGRAIESATRKDRTTKAARYARFGVPHYWIVDPDARTLETYELEADAYRLAAKDGGDAVVRPPLFPGLEIRLGEIWAP